jgi:VWFA-related protein
MTSMNALRPLILLLVAASSSASLVAHQSAPPRPPAGQPAAGQAVRTKAVDATAVTAIVVDVVVRDRDGKPVTDLKASDFELYEEKVLQDVGSFTLVNRSDPTAAPAATPAAPVTPAPGAPPATTQAPQVIALLFDRLTPDAKSLAYKAALNYIGQGSTANNVVGVFGIDLSLIFYQPFTRDGDALRKAVEDAVGRATSGSQSGRSAALKAAQAADAAQATLQAQESAAGQGGTVDAAAAANAQFSSMTSRIAQQFTSLEADEEGYSTANALLAIVSSMKAIPGRKSMVFFSEGLSITSNVQSRFTSVIAAANRANVSIYPMDAAGLRTESTLAATREGVQGASSRRMNANPTTLPNDRPMTEALETNEALLHADPHSGLGQLADQTGGFLIANSNDLRDGFGRIDTDMRHYYVLTYVPKNTNFDGKFREIDVKVKRPGVRVRGRKGYFAVNTAAGASVLDHEARALAALARTPVPNAFPVRALPLTFPETGKLGLTPVLVTLPTSGITFLPSDDKKTYTSDFVVLVQFKDDQGQVLEKVSQRYRLNGPIEQLDRARLGEVLFYREPMLIPGTFSTETVVYDMLADKASVRFGTYELPPFDAKALRLSSLIVVRKSERVPTAERPANNPLYVGDQLLYPSMGEPFSKAAFKELPFYFVAYPASGGTPVQATLQLASNGQKLAEAPLELAAASPDGRVVQVSRIPIEALPPGTYELRVSVRQGSVSATRGVTFRLVP